MQALAGQRRVDQTQTPKRLWPVGLSIIAPGMGHFAVGAIRRAIVIIVSLQVLALIVAVVSALHSPWIAGSLVVIAIAARIPICIDARRLDGTYPRPKPRSILLVGAGLLVASEVTSGLRHELISETYRIPGSSMLPTLIDGDHVAVTKLASKPRIGELVAYAIPGQEGALHLKRAVGVEGDTVTVTAEGLFINGSPTRVDDRSEPCEFDPGNCSLVRERLGGVEYVAALSTPVMSAGEWSVPEGAVFVIGDHRNESLDSRHVGPIPLAAIVGKPTFVWWSSSASGLRWSRTWMPVR